jgi:hypothetical protein
MSWMPSEGRRWFLKHGNLVVAICSLFVAVLTVLYTISNSTVEQNNREALAYPYVALHVDPNSYKIRYANLGPGAAKVRRLEVVVKGECYNVDDAKDWAIKSPEYFRSVMRSLISEVFGVALWKTGREIPPAISGSADIMGAVIPAGGEFVMVRIDTREMEVFETEMDKIDKTLKFETREKFRLWARKFPIGIEVCSLIGPETERNCGHLGVEMCSASQ